MPNKRKRDVPAIPDITEDPVERKRVLSMLAQRRYRERKRKQLEALQAQVESHSASNKGLDSLAPDLTRNISSSSGTNFLAMENVPFTDGFGDCCPHTMPEIEGQTSSLPSDSMDLIPDASLLAFPQSLLPSSFPFSAEDPFSSAPLPDLMLPFHSGDSPQMLQLMDQGDFSLSDQLQTYQTSTFSFPDDHLLEIPSLTLLNAAMKVAERLNLTGMLWDFSAISPFYRKAADAQTVSSPPSLVSGSSSPSTTFNSNDEPAEGIIELPRHLQPTTSQRLIPHHPILDLLPWPAVRDKLIQVFSLPPAMRPKSAQDPLGLLRFVYDMEDVGGEGIRVRGHDPFAAETWEVGQVIFERWWWAFDGEIVERSDCARRERGEKQLTLRNQYIKF